MELNLAPQVENGIVSLEDRVKHLKVIDAEHRNEVLGIVKEVKMRRNQIVEFFKDSKKKAYDTWKAISANEKSFTDRLDFVERNIKKAVIEWDHNQEKLREQERARLQAIEDARAEKERQRLIKQAEKLKTPELKDQRLEEAESIVAPSVQVEEPEKVEGVVSKKIWKARVVDVDKVPREYLIVNEKALDSIARSTKGAIKIPGVEFFTEDQLAIKAN